MPANLESKADKSQERFYDALRGLFVGAKVEGESGFINLMRIKSRYYTDGVFPRLRMDIAKMRNYCVLNRPSVPVCALFVDSARA